MRQRAEGLLKRLNKRSENKVERNQKLDQILEAYEQKHASNSIPTQPGPVPVQRAPNPAPEPLTEIDPELRRARIAELTLELKQVEHQEEQIRKGSTQGWSPHEQRLQREIHAAIRAEYASLVPKPESRLTPEEAERIKQQQVREAATDRWLREQDEEIKRQATRPGLDIKMRLQAYEEEIGGGACLRNGDLYVSAPNTWSVYEELHNRR